MGVLDIFTCNQPHKVGRGATSDVIATHQQGAAGCDEQGLQRDLWICGTPNLISTAPSDVTRQAVLEATSRSVMGDA
jgi:hypothetical protein